MIERALDGELMHHLGCPPGGMKPDDVTNHRNGKSRNTVLTDDGPVTIAVPRDRDGSLEPRLIGKHERRFRGFDDKVLALYCAANDGPRGPKLPRGYVGVEVALRKPSLWTPRTRPHALSFNCSAHKT